MLDANTTSYLDLRIGIFCRTVLNRFTPNAGKDYIHGRKGFASYD